MRNFLVILLAVQVALLALVGIEYTGFSLPFLRQIIGFVYLTFIPGFLILSCFKNSRLNLLNIVLYSIGLSFAFAMFVGLILNLLLPALGMSKPLSNIPVTATCMVITLPLTVFLYMSKRKADDIKYNLPHLNTNSIIFLVFIVLISVAGAYQAAVYQSSTILLITTAVIALTAFLAASNKFITEDILPLTIFVIAVALLYQVTLNGQYLSGYSDIHMEYNLYNLAFTNGYWNASITYMYNAMLSVSMLPTIYSVIAHIDGLFIFKVIYPLFFSLVPVALYSAGRELISKRGAFLAAFLFVSFSAFYTDLPFLFRQGIAEIFLALCLLVLVDKNVTRIQKVTLLIIFAVTIVVSHYTVTYLMIFTFLFAWISLVILKSRKDPLSRRIIGPHSTFLNESKTNIVITGGFVLLFIVVALAWYMYMAGASPFRALVQFGQHVYSTGLSEMLSLSVRGRSTVLVGIALGAQAKTWLNEVNRIIFYVTELFIVVGLLVAWLKHDKLNWPLEYIVLLPANMILLLLSIVLPYFSSQVSIARLYHITLIFLAPVCVLGAEYIFSRIHNVFLKLRNALFSKSSLDHEYQSGKVIWYNFALSVILVLYFLFNTGFVFALGGQTSPLTPCNLTNIEKYTTDEQKVMYFNMIGYAFPQDVLSARWLADNSGEKTGIFADVTAMETVLTSNGLQPRTTVFTRALIKPGNYIYLRYVNTRYNLISLPSKQTHYTLAETNETPALFNQSDKIYTNGRSEVLLQIAETDTWSVLEQK